MSELTITQATERLQARGLDVARRTVASWVEQGLFTGRLVETPAGKYWVIPAREVVSFEPPKPGRRPKSPAAEKRATGQKRAKGGAPTGPSPDGRVVVKKPAKKGGKK